MVNNAQSVEKMRPQMDLVPDALETIAKATSSKTRTDNVRFVQKLIKKLQDNAIKLRGKRLI